MFVVCVEMLRTWPMIVTCRYIVRILRQALALGLRTCEMGEPSILNSVLSFDSASMICLIVTGRKLSFLKFYSMSESRQIYTDLDCLTEPPLGLVCDPPLKKPPPPVAPPPALYDVVLP